MDQPQWNICEKEKNWMLAFLFIPCHRSEKGQQMKQRKEAWIRHWWSLILYSSKRSELDLCRPALSSTFFPAVLLLTLQRFHPSSSHLSRLSCWGFDLYSFFYPICHLLDVIYFLLYSSKVLSIILTFHKQYSSWVNASHLENWRLGDCIVYFGMICNSSKQTPIICIFFPSLIMFTFVIYIFPLLILHGLDS